MVITIIGGMESFRYPIPEERYKKVSKEGPIYNNENGLRRAIDK